MNVFNDTGLEVGWLVGHVPPHSLSGTLVVKGTFAIEPGKPAVVADEQAGLDADTPDPDGQEAILRPTDFAPLKLSSDVLLAGSACAPRGTNVEVLQVTFGVGSWSRSLLVLGDRIVKRSFLVSHASEPLPFDSIPLSYTRSYGGAGFARNPDGRGHGPTKGADGSDIHYLPNIIRQEDLGAKADMKLEPAGFGPLPEVWPQRMGIARKATYDQAWLEDTWPGYPRDFDFAYFNAAPRDQQLKGYLKGDEKVWIDNAHLDHRHLEFFLPAVRLRWFLREEWEGSISVREVTLHLDTLWVDIDEMVLQLVWRGVTSLRTKKMSEISDHLCVREALADPPRSLEDYSADLEARRVAEESPAEEEGEEDAERPIAEMEIEDPDTSWVDELKKDAEQLKAEAAQEVKEAKAKVEALAKELRDKGVEVPDIRFPEPGMGLPGPANPYDAALATFTALQSIYPDLMKGVKAPQPEEFEIKMPENFPQDEGEEVEPIPERKRWSRESCQAHAAEGGSFANEDLTGVDLSELDLRGLDFSGAVLKEANLRQATLEEARFEQSVLMGADLAQCNLRSATLSFADISKATLTGADLSGASLPNADLSGARLDGCTLTKASAPEATFHAADLTGADLSGADLTMADLDEAALSEAKFVGAKLVSASLQGAKGPGADFRESDLTGAKFAESEFLAGVFTKTKARDSVWEEAKLDGASFTYADLRYANFEAASLPKANFHRSDLTRARFPEANLREAMLTQVNLFRGTLEGASLTNASFVASNLYEVEFLDAEISETEFHGAILKGTKLA